MPDQRTPKTFQVSAQTTRLIDELGDTLDLTSADVLATRRGLVVIPEDTHPRRLHLPYRRQVADPAGPIPTKHNDAARETSRRD
jgi:hypothetical protein